MDIAFRGIPGSVFLGGLGIFIRVRGIFHAVHGGVGTDPVGSVAVFALQVMGQQHVRLKAPDPAGHHIIDVVLVPVLILFAQLIGEGVLEVAVGGIIPYAAGPHAVQQFQPAVGHGGHHHTDLADFLFFSGIPGKRTAEPQHFVILMSHQQHQVRLFGAGFPLLHFRRRFTGTVNTQLCHVEVPFFSGCVADTENGGAFRQRQVFCRPYGRRPSSFRFRP